MCTPCFTTVRDTGGADWGIKTAIETGHIIGPRTFIAGQEVVPPIEIIRSATTIGAEVLRMPGWVETLQPGACRHHRC